MTAFSLQAVSKRNWIAAGCLAAGIFLRLEYLREFSQSPLWDLPLGADVSEYFARAQAILQGAFSGNGNDIHAPLYSFFLALELKLAGGWIPAVRILQLVLQVASWGCFYVFLRKRSNPGDRTPEWVLAGGMLYLPLIFFGAELICEALLLPLLLGAAACVLALEDCRTAPGGKSETWFAVGGGVLTGLAVITHPATLCYWVLQTAALCRNRGKRLAVLYGIPALGILLAVSLVRSAAAGRFVPVQSNSFFNLYLGNSEDADGTCRLRPGRAWRMLHREARFEADAKGCTMDRIFAGRVLKFVTEHPFREAGLLGKKLLFVFSPSELPAGADTPQLLKWTFLMYRGAGVSAAFWMVLALAGAGCGFVRDTWRRYGALVLMAGAFLLVQVAFVTSGRYRLPMLPGLFALGAAFFAQGSFSGRRRMFAFPAACAVVTSAWLASPRPDTEAESRTLFAEAWLQKNVPEKAVELLQDTAGASNDPARDWCLLAAAERKLGMDDRAKQHLAEAVSAAPEEAEAWMNLGVLASDYGDYGRALECYCEAAKREPLHPDNLFNHALTLEKMRRYPEAAALLEKLLRIQPKNRRALNSMGRICFLQGALEAAEEYFEKAGDLAPDDRGIERNLNLTRELLRRKSIRPKQNMQE